MLLLNDTTLLLSLWAIYLSVSYYNFTVKTGNELVRSLRGRTGEAMAPFWFCVQISMSCALFVIHSIQAKTPQFIPPACFFSILVLFSPYLAKPSRLRRNLRPQCHWSKASKYRHVCDHLIASSLIYAGSGLFAIYLGEYWCALMNFMTACSSILYHRYREAMVCFLFLSLS